MSYATLSIEDRGPVVLAVTAAMIGTSTLFVFFRLVSRAGIVKRVSIDDYFMFVAWVSGDILRSSVDLRPMYRRF